MNRLILYLIKRRFHLKWLERFRFTNQKKLDVYWFDKDGLYKMEYLTTRSGKVLPVGMSLSGVSLNWMLDKDCKIEKITGVLQNENT